MHGVDATVVSSRRIIGVPFAPGSRSPATMVERPEWARSERSSDPETGRRLKVVVAVGKEHGLSVARQRDDPRAGCANLQTNAGLAWDPLGQEPRHAAEIGNGELPPRRRFAQ